MEAARDHRVDGEGGAGAVLRGPLAIGTAGLWAVMALSADLCPFAMPYLVFYLHTDQRPTVHRVVVTPTPSTPHASAAGQSAGARSAHGHGASPRYTVRWPVACGVSP